MFALEHQVWKLGSIEVSGWLTTYSSPKSQFWPKWGAIVRVDLGRGRFSATQNSKLPKVLPLKSYFINLLRARRGARNPNLQAAITHARQVCSFRLDFQNGMRRTQSDHARLGLLSLVIWSRAFWPSATWNLHKAQRLTKIVLTFDRCRPHSVTFGYCGRQEEPSILISRAELLEAWLALTIG